MIQSKKRNIVFMIAFLIALFCSMIVTPASARNYHSTNTVRVTNRYHHTRGTCHNCVTRHHRYHSRYYRHPSKYYSHGHMKYRKGHNVYHRRPTRVVHRNYHSAYYR